MAIDQRKLALPPDAVPRRRAGAAAKSSAEERSTVTTFTVPEAELTPRVRAVLDQLRAENAVLRRDLDAAQRRVAALERVADEDALAPIFNRRAFLRELGRALSYSRRYRTPGSLIYFDLNGLKRINDTRGHAAGDAALVHTAEVLLRNLRDSDLVGRLGGDEFGVLLRRAERATALRKAEALAAAVAAAPLVWHDETIRVELAYGVHAFDNRQDAEAVLAAADRAMYQRKRTMKRRRNRAGGNAA